MSHVPHELHDEFPAAAAALHELKMSNPHFKVLAERHHVLNHEIHRIEAGVEATSDERFETLKKERLALLDQVAAMLKEVGHA
jgi:uncharacterized protein YdcH (DUF465 family)